MGGENAFIACMFVVFIGMLAPHDGVCVCLCLCLFLFVCMRGCAHVSLCVHSNFKFDSKRGLHVRINTWAEKKRHVYGDVCL